MENAQFKISNETKHHTTVEIPLKKKPNPNERIEKKNTNNEEIILKLSNNKYQEESEKNLLKKTDDDKFSLIRNENVSHETTIVSNKSITNVSNGTHTKNGHTTSGTADILPPKPLPRTSRNNSVSEQGNSFDEADKIPRPVARPRTSTTYKVDKKIVVFFFIVNFFLRFGCLSHNVLCCLACYIWSVFLIFEHQSVLCKSTFGFIFRFFFICIFIYTKRLQAIRIILI